MRQRLFATFHGGRLRRLVARRLHDAQAGDADPVRAVRSSATSIAISVSPDILTQDGASQSLVTVTARDPNGRRCEA